MAKYECIGYRRMEGTSKKTGKPYSFTTVFAIDHNDYSQFGVIGQSVRELTIPNVVLDRNPKQLTVGCRFKVYYNEARFVEECIIE